MAVITVLGIVRASFGPSMAMERGLICANKEKLDERGQHPLR